MTLGNRLSTHRGPGVAGARDYIPPLTGLRFFAAAAIVLTHSEGYFFRPGHFGPLLLAGAVPLFFVLSGFVLTINQSKYASASEFLAARIGRIWPAHLAAIGFLLLIFWPWSLSLLHGTANLPRLLLNVLLLQAWSPAMATYWSLNSPSWSVSCELLFYLIFPWCLGWCGRATGWRIAALYVVTALAVLTIAWMVPTLDANWLGCVNPPVDVPVFLLGIAAARWFMNTPAATVSFRKATLLQCLAVAAALGANMAFAPLAATGLPQAFVIYLRMSGPTPCYAALLIALARYDGAISRLLSVGAVVYLGEISYSIYLFHQLIIRWYSVHIGRFSDIPLAARYAGFWLAVIVVAGLCHRLVEGPGRRGIRMAWMAMRPRVPRPARS